MKYEFISLDRLVAQAIRPEILRYKQLDELNSEAPLYLEEASAEADRICQVLHENFYANPESGGAYITHHLHAAAACTVQLAGYMKMELGNARKTAEDIYYGVCRELARIISFIQKQFRQIFDDSIAIPFTMAAGLQAALADSVKTVSEKLGTDVLVKKLLDIVIQPITGVLNAPYEIISFKTYGYFHLLLHNLLLARSDENESSFEYVNRILLSFNFNDPDYIIFYTRHLSGLHPENPEEKLNQLNLELKLLGQIEKAPYINLSVHAGIWGNTNERPLTPIARYESFPSATEQLQQWITKEIAFLSLQGHSDGIGFEKINTGLSIWQLAIFINAFLETGVFISESEHSYAATIRSVGRIVKTVGQDNISLESLRTKIYSLRNIDGKQMTPAQRKAVDSCRELFLKCYQICKKMGE